MGKKTIVEFSNVKLNYMGLWVVEPPKLSFKCVLVLDDKMEKAVENDILSQQEFKDQALLIYKQTQKLIDDKIEIFDALFVNMIENGADDKAMTKQMKGLNDAIKKDMKVAEKAAELSVMKVWKNFQTKKKEWKKFKFDVAFSFVTTVANFGISIAAMATSPFTGGLSAALAIVKLLKTIVKLSETIKTITTDTSNAIKKLNNEVKNVESTATKKKLNTSREVSAALLNEVIGASHSSIKTVQKAASVVKGKYAGLVVTVHELSTEAAKTIRLNETLRNDFRADAEKRLKNYPIVDKAKQRKLVEKGLDTALKDGEAMIDSQLTSIIKQYDDLKVHAKEIEDLFKKCTALNLKDSNSLKAFREFLEIATLTSKTSYTLLKVSEDAATRIKKVTPALVGYSYKKISSLALKDTVWNSGIVAG